MRPTTPPAACEACRADGDWRLAELARSADLGLPEDRAADIRSLRVMRPRQMTWTGERERRTKADERSRRAGLGRRTRGLDPSFLIIDADMTFLFLYVMGQSRGSANGPVAARAGVARADRADQERGMKIHWAGEQIRYKGDRRGREGQRKNK